MIMNAEQETQYNGMRGNLRSILKILVYQLYWKRGLFETCVEDLFVP